jgi:multidrug resistance efflux pump
LIRLASTYAVNQAGVDLMRRQLKDARVVAPFGGIAAARQVSPGQVISRNSTLSWPVDLDKSAIRVSLHY